MERKSPRAGRGARAGKSKPADLSVFSSEIAGGRVKRRAGRPPKHGLGYPASCTGLKTNPLAVCLAEFRQGHCLGCIREGQTAVPVEWPFGAINIIGHRSVQVLRSSKNGCWYVVTFVVGCRVDPRFPVIACKARAAAVELAKLRGRQLAPGCEIKEDGPGAWRVGGVFVWAFGDGW